MILPQFCYKLLQMLTYKYIHFFSTGKPVAVTSNRGAGKAPLRPGANPQIEQQYYQNKLLNGKAGTDKSVCLSVCF